MTTAARALQTKGAASHDGVGTATSVEVTIPFRIFGILFVLAVGLAVITTLVGIQAWAALDRGVDLSLRDRVLITLYNDVVRYALVALLLSWVVPLVSVIAWSAYGRRRVRPQEAARYRALLGLWLGAVGLGIAVFLTALTLSLWRPDPVMLPALFFLGGPVLWALAPSIYNALLFQQCRHFASITLVGPVPVAFLTLVCLFAQPFGAVAIPLAVWWISRHDSPAVAAV